MLVLGEPRERTPNTPSLSSRLAEPGEGGGDPGSMQGSLRRGLSFPLFLRPPSCRRTAGLGGPVFIVGVSWQRLSALTPGPPGGRIVHETAREDFRNVHRPRRFSAQCPPRRTQWLPHHASHVEE